MQHVIRGVYFPTMLGSWISSRTTTSCNWYFFHIMLDSWSPGCITTFCTWYIISNNVIKFESSSYCHLLYVVNKFSKSYRVEEQVVLQSVIHGVWFLILLESWVAVRTATRYTWWIVSNSGYRVGVQVVRQTVLRCIRF